MSKETKQTLSFMAIAICLFALVMLLKSHFLIIITLCVWLAFKIVVGREEVFIADENLMEENNLLKAENRLKAKENHKLLTHLQELQFDYVKMFRLYCKNERLGAKHLSLFEQVDLAKLEGKYDAIYDAKLLSLSINELSQRLTAHKEAFREVKS